MSNTITKIRNDFETIMNKHGAKGIIAILRDLSIERFSNDRVNGLAKRQITEWLNSDNPVNTLAQHGVTRIILRHPSDQKFIVAFEYFEGHLTVCIDDTQLSGHRNAILLKKCNTAEMT